MLVLPIQKSSGWEMKSKKPFGPSGPKSASLGFAGFVVSLFLAVGFELGFRCEAFFFVQGHHAWVIPNVDGVGFGFG
jgi:hypothetical protein